MKKKLNKKEKSKIFHYTFLKKNRKGWVRVAEVFIAILLIMGVFSIVIDKDDFQNKDRSSEIYDTQISILRSIELNESLRSDILSVSLPVFWSDFEANGLTNLRNEIIDKTSPNLFCEAQICEITSDCLLDTEIQNNIYVENLIISADLDNYSPRKVNLFCFDK